MIPPTVHRIAWIGTALAALVVMLAAAAVEGTQPWAGWDPSREFTRPGYAERVRADRPIRTRANTFSNLAYVTAGLYACGLALADRRANRRAGAPTANAVMAAPTLSLLFGLSCVWLGFSSGLFHASLTRAGQRLDVAAMYPPLLSLLAIAVARRLPSRMAGPRGGIPTEAILAAIVVTAGLCLWTWKWSMSATTTLLCLIGAVAVVAVAEHLSSPARFRAGWLAVAAVCLVAGIVCRQTDVARTFPVDPESWLQGHALWHVLTAAALLAMYFRERSETPRSGVA